MTNTAQILFADYTAAGYNFRPFGPGQFKKLMARYAKMYVILAAVAAVVAASH